MPYSDLHAVIVWWSVLFVLGVVSFPIASRIFSAFFDKGYVFGKILGLALLSYFVFVAGIIHLLPFTQLTVFTLFFLLFVINILVVKGKNLLRALLNSWKIMLFEEILFFLGLLFWSFVRGTQPDIHGLEKYMDFGFVNSILRSTYFPPTDMWYPPFPLNYYYFGHLATAVITKLSGIASNITFNLMLATLFSFTITASFSLGTTFFSIFLQEKNILLKGKSFLKIFRFSKGKFLVLLTGIFAAFFVALEGNLHTIYLFFKPYNVDKPVPFWQLVFSPNTFPNAYWYPNATRFIYHTIHEFPIYSFVVSDLHGHVLDIPFVLLTIATLFAFFLKQTNGKSNKAQAKNNKNLPRMLTLVENCLPIPKACWPLAKSGGLEFGNLGFIGFLLAIMYMTNAWDGLIYLLLSVGIILALRLDIAKLNLKEKIFSIDLLKQLLVLGISFFIFSRPFALFFDTSSLVHGIGIMCAPKILTNIGNIGPFLFEPNHCEHSPWWQLITLYGFFLFWIVGFIIFLLFEQKRNKGKWFATDSFVLYLIILSLILIIIPEFAYLKDIYPTYYRANTMFKLVYQAFIMLSLASGYILVRVTSSIKHYMSSIIGKLFALCYLLFALILLTLVAIYPYFAITSYYGNLQTYSGLDGTKYLQKLYPTDYDAILWINKYIAGQPVMLEAQGDSYTDYARISANTGLPTPLGWTVHEWLWRGSYDVTVPRINDVKTLYETSDIATTKALLKKYNIQYVFVGVLERQKYHVSLEKFAKLGRIVYQNGETDIYKM